jgi:hypothetical protein
VNLLGSIAAAATRRATNPARCFSRQPSADAIFSCFAPPHPRPEPADEARCPFRDPALPRDTRIQELVTRLTLPEKINQLVHENNAVERRRPRVQRVERGLPRAGGNPSCAD